MLARELHALLHAQRDQLSPKDALLREMVEGFHKNNKENLQRLKTDFDKTQETGRYAIEMKAGYNAQKYPWLRTLVWQCMKKHGGFVPLDGAAGNGGGAGGPAAAARPNALLDGEPYTIALPSGKSTDLDEILKSVFGDMNGRLEFTYDNIKSSTDRFARREARELGVVFNTEQNKAPIWYDEMINRKVIHNILAPIDERVAKTAVGTYNEDQTTGVWALRNSMVHTQMQNIPNTFYNTGIQMTTNLRKKLASEIVDKCLGGDDFVPLHCELERDDYDIQFSSQQAQTTLPPRAVERALKTPPKQVLPVLDKEQAKSNSTRAANKNPRLILTLAPQQAPSSVLATLGVALKEKLKEAGLRANVELIECTRRRGLHARTKPRVVVTPMTGSNLTPICKWFERKEILDWLQPLVLSVTEEDNAPPRRKRDIDESEEEDDKPLAAKYRKGALAKRPNIVDSDEENDKPSSDKPTDNAPSSVTKRIEIMPDVDVLNLGTVKNNAACREVLAGIFIEDIARNEVPPSIPIENTAGNNVVRSIRMVNTAGNNVRPSIPIPRKKVHERKPELIKAGIRKGNGGARVSWAEGVKCSYESRMGWWQVMRTDLGKRFWEHSFTGETTLWEKRRCNECKHVIWKNRRSTKITTKCPWERPPLT
jgi:hypothetical protein